MRAIPLSAEVERTLSMVLQGPALSAISASPTEVQPQGYLLSILAVCEKTQPMDRSL